MYVYVLKMFVNILLVCIVKIYVTLFHLQCVFLSEIHLF